MARRGGLYASLHWVIALAGCAPSTPAAHTSPTQVEHLLIQEISQDLAQDSTPFERSRFTVTRRRSAVLDGVTYHWGEYRPPVTHGRITALVASGPRLLVVRNAGDWEQLWRRSGKAVHDRDTALSVCEELIETTGSLRGSRPNTEFYSERTVLSSLTLVNSDKIEATAKAPEIQQDGNEWRVRLWQLQPWQTVQFVCRIAPDNVSYTPVDTIAGSGRIGT